MVRALVVVGLVLLLAGGAGYFAYYPITGKRPADLKVAEKIEMGSITYPPYRDGDKVTVYGAISRMDYDSNQQQTALRLDFVDLQFLVPGDQNTRFKVGDNVQIKVYLDEIVFIVKVQFWRSASADDMSPMFTYQMIFAGVAVVGLLLALVGLSKKKGAVPAMPPR